MIAVSTPAVVPGDVVQIDPAHDPIFGGLLMFVEEVSTWGVQGCILTPAVPPLLYPYRAPFSAVAWVGRSRWPMIG